MRRNRFQQNREIGVINFMELRKEIRLALKQIGAFEPSIEKYARGG
jgi:hypothetical protein